MSITEWKTVCDWSVVVLSLLAGIAWTVASFMPVSIPLPRITADYDADVFNAQMAGVEHRVKFGLSANRTAAFLTALSAVAMALSVHLSNLTAAGDGK